MIPFDSALKPKTTRNAPEVKLSWVFPGLLHWGRLHIKGTHGWKAQREGVRGLHYDIWAGVRWFWREFKEACVALDTVLSGTGPILTGYLNFYQEGRKNEVWLKLWLLRNYSLSHKLRYIFGYFGSFHSGLIFVCAQTWLWGECISVSLYYSDRMALSSVVLYNSNTKI